MNFSLHHIRFPRRACALREERGAVLVEFALVLPVLALVLFGILDFGKAYNYWIDETQLASEAARYATVDQNPAGNSGTSFLAAVKSQANTLELKDGKTTSVPDPLQVCVSFPNGTHNVGDPVQIQVKSSYKFMSILGGGLPVQMHATSTMRLERVPTSYSNGDCA